MKKMTLLLTIALAGIVSAQEPVTISNQYLTVSISPFGAELQSIRSNTTGREYLWHGDAEIWDHRAPVMFPVAVRLKDNEFRYDRKDYEMPTLGIALNRMFEVSSSAPESASFVLESDESTMENYPFEFRFTVTYSLLGNELTEEYTVENTGKKPLYYAMGGHPAFVLPLEDGITKENFAFTFPEPVTAERMLIEGGLVDSKTERFLKKESFLNMDDNRLPSGGILFESELIKKVGLAKQGEEPFLEMDLGTFPYINLSMQYGKPFICLEPLVGHHDTVKANSSIEKKKCLLKLLKDKSESYHFSIIIHEPAAQ